MSNKSPHTHTLAESLASDSEQRDTAETESPDPDPDTTANSNTRETPRGESSPEPDPTEHTPAPAQPVPHESPWVPHDPRRTSVDADRSGPESQPTVALSWTGIHDIVIPRCPHCTGVGTVSHYTIAPQDGLLDAHCDDCPTPFLVDPNPDDSTT